MKQQVKQGSSLRLAATVFLSLILLWLGAAWHHRPVNLGFDAPNGKLRSLSFAPFRPGQSPLTETFPTPDEIAADLALISGYTESIRTYASGGGLAPIPAYAGHHGLTVTQGAWLGWEDAANQREIAALIAAANAYPDVVTRVIVGNEVLLRGEMPPSQLHTHIRAVQAAVGQPVSYADVWSMYLKHPEIIEAVDFITIHILPYWEDEPVAATAATAHLEQIVATVAAEAKALGVTKPIFIGESGWPTRGRQRGFAVPGVVNAAHYIRGLITSAHRHGLDYNIVEAFDQPWKAALEGTVGATWGLLSADRALAYPLVGGVAETPHWLALLGWATALIIVSTVLLRWRLNQLSIPALIGAIGLICLGALGLVTCTDHAWRTSFTSAERGAAVLAVLGTTILGGLAARRALDIAIDTATPFRETVLLRALYLIGTGVALYHTSHFARHGRYISFPLEYLYVPLTALAALVVARTVEAGAVSRQHCDLSALIGAPRHPAERLLSPLLVLAVGAMFIGETHAFVVARDLRAVYPTLNEALPVALRYTLGNTQALLWGTGLLILAYVERWRGRPA